MQRRTFLKAGAAGLAYAQSDLFRHLVDTFAARLAGSSTAQAASAEAFNYLLFLHPGAPPRWCMDAFLSPNYPIVDGQPNAEYVPHIAVKNVAKSAGSYLTAYANDNTKMTFETTSSPHTYLDRNGVAQQIYMPKIWEVTLPEWSGGAAGYTGSPVRMSDMLNETMIIRGYQLAADFGHMRGPSLQSQPVASEPSISGLAADAAATLIPAVALTDSPSRPLGFRGRQSSITMGNAGGTSNRATDLLQSFLRAGLGSTHAGNRQLMQAALNTALDVYRHAAEARDPQAKLLYDNVEAVSQLVTKLGSIDVVGEFQTLRNKYAALIRYASVGYPGLIGDVKMTVNGAGTITSISYMTDDYADKFALAELFIKYDLTASFTFICGGTAGPGSFTTISNNPSFAFNDEHLTADRMLSAFCQQWKFRAWMTCVKELSRGIGPTKWAKTAVQYGAEYARSPNASSGGSDHSINACVTTVVSGAITSFLPIGNIYKTAVAATDHNNYGTYGVGAATDVEGKGPTKIPNEYVANTVLTLLGIESPLRDKTALIKKVGNAWLPKTEAPKNV